jgi:glycosyltransferase involved in cell wall biosynthesis
MTPPQVSVVLPFHNAAGTLPLALASIQSQTLSALEILCVDDGSTDGGAAWVSTAAQHDSRVKLLSPGRVGLVNALRAGCAAATAARIARMDADDTSHPERLARQCTWLDSHPDMALCGTGVHISGPAASLGAQRYAAWLNALTTAADVAREIYVECPVAHPAFLFRRDAFDAVGGYDDAGWPEDYDLVLRLHAAGWTIGNVPEILLDWHDHHGRLSRNDPRYSPESFRACKRHYLLAGPLYNGQPFYQWGAGEVGKRWLREWGARRPVAVVDINPRKIGVTIHGYAVIAMEQLPPPGSTLTLVAVGAPDARTEIRAWCAAHHYEEGRDYLFIA